MTLLEYFTEEEFREVAQDDNAPSTFDDDEIQRGHDEVVNRLELWGRTSWFVRQYSLYRLASHSYLNLSRTPVIDIVSFELAGDAVADADYILDIEGGRIMWGDWAGGVPALDGGPYLTQVTWTYGHQAADASEVPWDIKRPVILATASLLRPQKQKSKIPPNTRSYTTGRTSFDFRFERAQTRPWPWDESMSSQVRAVWDPFRFRQYVS